MTMDELIFEVAEFGRKGGESDGFEGFDELLNAADDDGDEGGDDTAPTPAATPEGNEEDGDDAQPNAGPTANSSQDPAEDRPADVRAYLEQNPDHAPIVELLERQMKAAWTPKLQEAATLRQQLDGIDPQSIQTLRELSRMAEEDPAVVARYFREQAERFEQQAPTTEEPEFQTENERIMWEQIQEMKAWKQQQELEGKRAAFQQETQRVVSQLDKIEKDHAVTLTLEERGKLWDYARQRGLEVEDAYFLQNRAAILDKERQRARDEAAGVVTKKAAGSAGNPAGVPNRRSATPQIPTDFEGMVRYYEENGA